ncbi:hypothetical protein BU17DRAFT_95623 [Hysterangium stoloniferum]|nr:hypothetical protein BU17DRAFT_95623 [Hysterangium stoloniferum]
MNVSYESPAFDSAKGLEMHLRCLLELSTPSTEEYPPSFDFPNTYWSSTEKTTFFASVARNSRWRPDLISEDLGNQKTIGDVCSYINLLEQALTHTPHTDRNVASHPAAHEVSMDWIAIEEELAGQLNANELELHGYTMKVKRDEEIKAVKRSLREDDGEFGDKGGMSWRKRFQVRKQEIAHSWKREDFLVSLDRKYLRCMDAIIRTQEDAEVQGRPEYCWDNNGNPEMRLGYGEQPGTHIAQGASTSIHHADNMSSLRPRTPPGDYSQIDRMFLALDIPTQSAKNAVSTSTKGLPTEEILANLSPVSRRRLQKRLWMRRKRAMQSGLSASEASTDVKLKRGRKPKCQNEEYEATLADQFSQVNGTASIPSQALGEATTAHGQGEELVNSSTDRLAVQKRRPYGWATLQSLGIDAMALRAEGLDIFHLEKVARLASLFQDVHALSSDCPNEQQQPEISYNLMRLLRVCVVHFITRVIAHVVVHKNKQNRQKRHSKIAYQPDSPEEIRPETVHEALAFLEETGSSKVTFQRLSRIVRTAAAQRHQTDDEDENESDEESPESTSREAFNTSFGPHVPFIIENSADNAAFYWDSNRYIRKGKETAETLLDDINELALRKELKADAFLDETDRQADNQYECGLWAEVGVEVDLASQNQVINEEKQSPQQQGDPSHMAEKKAAQSLIYRKRGGAVKSRLYIDSDEDM